MTFEPATAGNSGLTTFSFNVTPDVTTWLPERAKEKLLALRQHSSDLNRLIPDFDQLREAGNEKIAAQGVLRRLQAAPAENGFNLKSDDVRVAEAERRLEKLTAEHDRLRKLSDERSATWRMASLTVSAVEAWLKDGKPSGVVLEDHSGPEPQLLKGETVLDGIERHRRRGRELKASLHTLKSAPFPSAHAKAQMRQQIEALAQRGAPSVSHLVEHDRPVEFADAGQSVPIIAGTKEAPVSAVVALEQFDALALVAWLHKPALIAALDREIDSEADDKAALTHEARQQQEAVVLGDLLAVERDESALVWQALSQRLPVEHRNDINPLALLGLALVTAARVNASPGTSPGHSFDLRR